MAQTPSAENKRKKLSKSVDTCVAETKKFNAVAPEISQSQLFTAIGSAIFNVFGNANLGSVSSAEKNTLEFLWWHALCMFGILCHKHGYEWKGDADVQSFEPLRKKNGIKSGSNINESLWKETPLRQHLGVPKPAEAEFEQYILQYHQDFSLAKISEARKCVTCGTTTSSKWLKSETGQNAFNCTRCYQRELAASANNTCVTCGTTTSSQWLKSKTGQTAFNCKNCYNIEHAASANKTCVTCGTTTSGKWLKSETGQNAFNCTRCYQRELAASANNTCVTCGTTTSSQWLKSETGASKCGSCYRRERAASANNTCVTCIETTSSKWYNLKTDPPTSKCKKCYMQEYNADKKRKREHPG